MKGAIVFESIRTWKCRGERVMHLEEMKKEIESLVLEKGFYNKREDVPKKTPFRLH